MKTWGMKTWESDPHRPIQNQNCIPSPYQTIGRITVRETVYAIGENRPVTIKKKNICQSDEYNNAEVYNLCTHATIIPIPYQT